jgi:hypothetical protein
VDAVKLLALLLCLALLVRAAASDPATAYTLAAGVALAAICAVLVLIGRRM